ncbi:Fur family transcriptional regulator [Desulfoferula mesophila]|uniref:Transcriptional repressor n=1 Tax=Desulfoferula mesophila TaxID=3058419 RepID=A0AAU9EPG7_9BACT|nr:transcriptional repressor [Desulfoferula mesophilus]
METPEKLRMTTQRQVIMEVLKGVTSHPTAGELCNMVRRRLPRISLGTVYRNLDILSRAGMLQKIDVAGQEMRFDGNTMNHYHLRCVDCGRVFDVDMDLLAGMEDRVADESGFEVLGHRLEFVGRCATCQEALKTRQ